MDALADFIHSFKHLIATLTNLLFHKRSTFHLCSVERLCDSCVVAFKTHFFKPHFPRKSQTLLGADFPSALPEVKAMGAVGVQLHPPSHRQMFLL